MFSNLADTFTVYTPAALDVLVASSVIETNGICVYTSYTTACDVCVAAGTRLLAADKAVSDCCTKIASFVAYRLGFFEGSVDCRGLPRCFNFDI